MDDVKITANVFTMYLKAWVDFMSSHDVPYLADLAMVSKRCSILIFASTPKIKYICGEKDVQNIGPLLPKIIKTIISPRILEKYPKTFYQRIFLVQWNTIVKI